MLYFEIFLSFYLSFKDLNLENRIDSYGSCSISFLLYIVYLDVFFLFFLSKFPTKLVDFSVRTNYPK